MSGWLWRQLGGWRRLHITGDHVEVLITQVITQGFRLWQVERRGEQFWCVVTEEGYDCLEQAARELGLAVRTVRQGGIPFRGRQLRQRPFLLVGLATAWALVFYVTTHIWVVQVTDPALSQAAKAEVVQAVAKAGLMVGASRSTIDIPTIRRRTLQQLPEYSWIGIHVQGVVASVDGIHFVKHPPQHLAAKLVASQPGRVTAVYVYMGAPEVQAGEQVVKGQTLISGVVSDVPATNPADAKTPISRSVITPAEGTVLADVSYRVRVFQPLIEHTWKATGHSAVHRYLEFNHGDMVAIWGFAPLSFSHYTTQKIVRSMRFAGVDWPVRMIDLVYNESVSHTVRLNRRQAMRRARERALHDVSKIVPKDATRVGDQVRVTLAPNGVWVSVTWVMNQNIAVPLTVVKPS